MRIPQKFSCQLLNEVCCLYMVKVHLPVACDYWCTHTSHLQIKLQQPAVLLVLRPSAVCISAPQIGTFLSFSSGWTEPFCPYRINPGRLKTRERFPFKELQVPPPPVEIWEKTIFIKSSRRTAAAESPPPTMVKAPLRVASIRPRGSCRPFGEFGNSNTPIGPFQTTRVHDLIKEKLSATAGRYPAPSYRQDGISADSLIRESAAKVSSKGYPLGSTISTPFFRRCIKIFFAWGP